MKGEVADIKYEPSTSFKCSKEQLGDIFMGDNVSVTLKGKVVGIRQSFDDKSQYDVELKPFKVTGVNK